MRELNTIQKREKLNKVYAVDETGNGGANHRYACPQWQEEQQKNRSLHRQTENKVA